MSHYYLLKVWIMIKFGSHANTRWIGDSTNKLMTKLFDFAITEFRIIFPCWLFLILNFGAHNDKRVQFVKSKQQSEICQLFFTFSEPVDDVGNTDKVKDQHHGLDAVPHRVRWSPRPGLQRRLFHTHEPDRQWRNFQVSMKKNFQFGFFFHFEAL